LNHEPLNTGSRKRNGLVFGEAVLMSSPPNRSQMDTGVRHQDFAESGFGGWADENIEPVREAAPMLSPEKIPSTTFDNISLSIARNKVINNFIKQFNNILATAHVGKRKFHDIRNTAITNWFRQGLSEYDVMTLAGHPNFATTHRFYLAVVDDLVDRARQATNHQVSQALLQKCSRSSQRGARP